MVRGLDVTVLARGVLDDARATLRIDDARLALGALRRVGARGARADGGSLAASLAFEMPTAPCQSLLQSVPSALVPTLEGAEMTGTFGAQGRLAFDSRKLDDLVFE